jgi:fucose permease
MNFFAAFQSEIFRPLVTLLIPGALAISSWLVALSWKFPGLKAAMMAHATETYWVLFFAITALGILIEDCGARIELHFDKLANEKTKGKHDEEWKEYLRTAFVADPIGRGYARSLVLRLKFQLGVLLGSIVAALGLIWLMFLGMDCRGAILLILLAAANAAWHYHAVHDVHQALADVRATLAGNIRIIPPEKQ